MIESAVVPVETISIAGIGRSVFVAVRLVMLTDALQDTWIIVRSGAGNEKDRGILS
jgi:hypothetical protein